MKKPFNFCRVAILIAKLLPIILFILFSVTNGNAQGLKFSTYVEQTVSSPKIGYAMGMVFDGYLGDFEVGGFIQKNSFNSSNEHANKVVEQQLHGIYMGLSFVQNHKWNVNFNCRVGLANNEMLVITPSMFADLMLTEHIGVGAGIGMRNFLPTGQVRVIARMHR